MPYKIYVDKLLATLSTIFMNPQTEQAYQTVILCIKYCFEI